MTTYLNLDLAKPPCLASKQAHLASKLTLATVLKTLSFDANKLTLADSFDGERIQYSGGGKSKAPKVRLVHQ